MEQELIGPSKELAYWTGVAQTDGSFYKRSYCDSWVMRVGVGFKSLPMLEKFRVLSKEIFGKESEITKRKRDCWDYYITITRFVESFKSLGIEFGDPKPPKWCVEKPEFLGAYLAGVIDGDGDIRIKRPEYPQCVIRITSGTPQLELKDSIKQGLLCGVTITKKTEKLSLIEGTRLIKGGGYSLEFLLSSKTMDFMKKFLIPWIQISYKRDKLRSYIAMTN